MIKTMSSSSYIITSPDGKTRASFIPERGGIAASIIVPNGNKEQELLFLHDYFADNEWPDLPGGWPFLFPVCARVERNGKSGSYLYQGNLYQMPMHGFAWRMPWLVELHNSNTLCMVLRDNPETQKVFPFAFELKLTYQVNNDQLICQQSYTNLSAEPMPYYAGFHPYFLTPAIGNGKEKVILDYQPVKGFQYNATYTDLIKTKDPVAVPSAITNPAINEQLTQVGNNKMVKLIYPDGFTLQIAAAGIEDPDLFSYIQLYTIPEKPFFCVEPWMGFPNAINTVAGVRWLQPQQSEHGVLTLTAFQAS